jgi:hypothetical protein
MSVSLDSFGTGSVALWARSSDFDTYLNVYDPSGNWLASNDWGGFMPSPDVDDAAINFPTTQSGVYEVQLSSSAGYGAGNFELYVSPGVNRKTTWTDRYGRCVFWISSSNTVGVITDQNSVVFYDVATEAITYQYTYQGTYGGAYSATQDRVFAWVVGDAPGFENIMVEYDNTGVQLTSSSFDAQIFWGGSTCYDDFNDRLFLVRTFGLYGPWAIWDCSTKTITQSGSVNTHGSTTYCTYANVNDRYYISFHNLSNNNAMEWVDAATYVTGTTVTTMHDYLQYEPVTQQIVATRTGGVIVMDPVADTTTTTFTDFGTFEGVVFDPCTQNMAALVDFNGAGGIITLDPSASYQVTNYIPVYSDTTDYTYGICHAESTSRVYLTSDDYDTNESSIWDCKITYPTTIITGIPAGVIEITASLPP